MIKRQILKVETLGGRETGDLRPAFSDDTPRGINYTVHEYNETEGWCIVEIWSSDHPVVPVECRHTTAKWNQMVKHPKVIEKLTAHPLSPTVIGAIGGMLGSKYKLDEGKGVVVETATIGTKKVVEHSYVRTVNAKIVAVKGEPEKDLVVFDEG